MKIHGNLIACTFSLFAVKQSRRITTFHSTGGALSFLFIVNNVLIYRIRGRARVSVRVSVSISVNVSIT